MSKTKGGALLRGNEFGFLEFLRKEGGTYQAERPAHAKQEGKKEQSLALEQEQYLGVEHLAGKRGCMEFMERTLDLICRQWEATEGFKLGCEVVYFERLLFGKLSDWRKQR